jgi:tetratricopeptide (TPR) repeat protein
VESYRKLDAPRRAAVAAAVILLLLGSTLPALSQASQSSQVPVPPLRTLLEQQRWQEIVDSAQQTPARSADDNYIYGMALAKLNRLSEARTAFLAAYGQNPQDSRSLVELAGIAFKEKDRPTALRWLLKAHKLAPKDAYISDFLGTVYFLEGNLDASLKYWNLAGKPAIENVRADPQLRLDPVILDRALAVSPGTLFRPSQLLASEARLRGLAIYPRFSFRLEGHPDGKFDAVLHARELNGFGTNKWTALLYTFRGVIFETVTPEYYNVRGSGTNITSLYRWDVNKRRVNAAVSGPLHRDPKWRYRLGFDFRNENWALRNFSAIPTSTLGNLNFRREAAVVEISSYRSGKWDWSTGAEFSNRDFRSVATDPGLSPDFFLGGKQLKHFARLRYDLLPIPEHRFTVSSVASTQEGRTWNANDPAFAKLQVGARAHWFPQTSGDDYEVHSQVRYGRTFGDVPFDELFLLGVERDNDLMLRAHVGTSDGKKGYAPLGRNYFVANWELDKRVYANGLFQASLGPFIDSGKITDPNPALGTLKWQLDAGGQLKIRALGVRFSVTYGKDTRSGKNAFYVYLTE